MNYRSIILPLFILAILWVVVTLVFSYLVTYLTDTIDNLESILSERQEIIDELRNLLDEIHGVDLEQLPEVY